MRSMVEGDEDQGRTERDQWLHWQGVGVMRIPAVDVLKNLDGVLKAIEAAVDRR